MTPAALARFLRRAEAMNVRAIEEHWKLVPSDLVRRLRPRTAHVGDGFLTLLETSDSLGMNRVIGLGHRGRVRPTTIDEIVSIAQAAKLGRIGVMLSPGPQQNRIARGLLAQGFVRHGGQSLLVRDCRAPVPRAGSGVHVVRARAGDAPIVVSILERCFGMPASRRTWSLAAAAIPAYERYLGYVGSTAVATGALRVEGDLAWLGGAGTLARWRRRGAQSALIAARLRRASRRGCRWAWVETRAPVPGRPSGSRRNLLRLGFEEVCVKPLFVWHGPSPGGERSGRVHRGRASC